MTSWEGSTTSKLINIIIEIVMQVFLVPRYPSMNNFTAIPDPVSQGFGVRKLYSGGSIHVRKPRAKPQTASLSVAVKINSYVVVHFMSY